MDLMKKLLKYTALCILMVYASFGAYVHYNTWKYNNSVSWALEQVEQGKAGPHFAYSRLVRSGNDHELITFVEKYIAEKDGQIMSHAIQLPSESDEEYLDRVNEGRQLTGFSKTTLQRLKENRSSRVL